MLFKSFDNRKNRKWILIVICIIAALLLNKHLQHLEYLYRYHFVDNLFQRVVMKYVVLNNLLPYFITLILMSGSVRKKNNSGLYILGTVIALIIGNGYVLFYIIIPNTIGVHVEWIRELCSMISNLFSYGYDPLVFLMPVMGIIAGYLSAHISFRHE